MTSIFSTEGSPFNMGHTIYFRITEHTTAPLNALELRTAIRKLIAHAEDANQRINLLEAIATGGSVSSPASDGVREAAETTLPTKGRKRVADSAAG